MRGRLTVSFHSGIDDQRFYNDPMLRRAVLDNGLKVLVQEEHTAPARVGLVLVQGRLEGRTRRA